jgi:anti-anti-sigma regulatory factor
VRRLKQPVSTRSEKSGAMRQSVIVEREHGMKMVLRKTKDSGIVMELSGELAGVHDTDTVSSKFTDAYSDAISYLIFDFANAGIPNSRFLGMMMQIYKLNKSRRVKTSIFCGRNTEVKNLFKTAYVDHIIPLIDDLPEAASSLKRLQE